MSWILKNDIHSVGAGKGAEVVMQVALLLWQCGTTRIMLSNALLELKLAAPRMKEARTARRVFSHSELIPALVQNLRSPCAGLRV